jgi:hypothetical protein
MACGGKKSGSSKKGKDGKETLNSFKKKLFNSDFDNLKKIFNSYKSGK